MARFYVGQRVRIKYSLGWPELAGKEGTIVGKPEDGGIRGGSEWTVAPDVWGTYVAPQMSSKGGKIFGPNSDQLEPITDSYDLASWESMRDLWVPEHLREDA